MANIITHQNPVYAGIPKKWVQVTDGDGTYYCEVMALSGGALSSVTTDATLAGAGTVASPLTTVGSIGTPYWAYFSMRGPGFDVPGTTYTTIAPIGAVGAGGTSTQDPTDLTQNCPQYAVIMPKCRLSDMQIIMTADTGLGETATISLQVDGVSPVDSPTLTFTNIERNKTDDTHATSIADGKMVCMKVVLSGGASWGGCTGRILVTPIP